MGKSVTRAILLAGISACVLSACNSVRGTAERPNILDRPLDQNAAYNTALSRYATIQANPEAHQFARNAVIDATIANIDAEYDEFISDLREENVTITTASEIGVLALTTAGGVSTDADFTRHASGLAALIGGANTSVSKNVLFERTVPALVAVMDAHRLEIFVRINAARQLPVDEYSLNQARRDLDAYHQAGSLMRAISALTATASQERQEQEDRVEDELNRTYFSEQLQTRTRGLITRIRSLNADQLEAVRSFPGMPSSVTDANGWANFSASDRQQILIRALFAPSEREASQLSIWENALTAAE